MSGVHSRQVPTDGIHGIAAWTYANAAARLAATGFVDPYDLFKVAIDLDTKAQFILTAITPSIVWGDVGNTGATANPAQSVTSTADTSTTSATYVVLNTMTVTPGAGTYLVMFSASGNGSIGAGDYRYGIHANAVLVAQSERRQNIGGGTQVGDVAMAMHSQCLVTVTAGQAIDVRYKASSGTYTVHQRNLILVKVG